MVSQVSQLMHQVGETVLQDAAQVLWEAAFLLQKVFYCRLLQDGMYVCLVSW